MCQSVDFFVYAGHCKFLVSTIQFDVTSDVAQDQMLLLLNRVDNAVNGLMIPFIG